MYYNDVYVIFNQGNLIEKHLDFRTGGQMLPSGSIPIAIVNCNTKKYFEIENSFGSKEILEYLTKFNLQWNGDNKENLDNPPSPDEIRAMFSNLEIINS